MGLFSQQTVPTASPTAEHLIEEAGKVVGFRLVLHVDNNACHLNINDVTVNSQGRRRLRIYQVFTRL